jgi:hypothetical protein
MPYGMYCFTNFVSTIEGLELLEAENLRAVPQWNADYFNLRS